MKTSKVIMPIYTKLLMPEIGIKIIVLDSMPANKLPDRKLIVTINSLSYNIYESEFNRIVKAYKNKQYNTVKVILHLICN